MRNKSNTAGTARSVRNVVQWGKRGLRSLMGTVIRGFLDWFLSHNPAAGPNLPDTPDWNAIARADAAREQAEAEDLRRLKEWLVWRESQEISGPWRKPGDN